jgi:hypothetical protein
MKTDIEIYATNKEGNIVFIDYDHFEEDGTLAQVSNFPIKFNVLKEFAKDCGMNILDDTELHLDTFANDNLDAIAKAWLIYQNEVTERLVA